MINEDKIHNTYALNPEQGFKLLMDYLQNPLYQYIRRTVVSHEDAEDILQEVFISVFRHFNQFRNESSLKTWVYRIATNECLRFLSKRAKQASANQTIQEDLLNKLESSEYIDYENELVVNFQRAILTLPEKQRTVFHLRYYEELTYTEIAAIVGGKPETVKVNYHHARNKIKVYIVNR